MNLYIKKNSLFVIPTYNKYEFFMIIYVTLLFLSLEDIPEERAKLKMTLLYLK